MVKVRKLMPARVFNPLWIWLILSLALLILLKYLNPIILALYLIGIVLSIIPTIYVLYQRTNEYRGENGFIEKEITFEAKNGNLYVNGNVMNNVKLGKRKKGIYVDDITTIKLMHGQKHQTYTFVGHIEGPYVDDFITFLKENNIKIK